MTSTQIMLHDVHPSRDLARRLKARCERLGEIHPDVRYCRVQLAGPVAGEPAPTFCVTLRVALPGAELAQEPERHARLGVALDRAFEAAAERLAQLAPARTRRAGSRRRRPPRPERARPR